MEASVDQRMAYLGISQKPDYSIYPERGRLEGFQQALQQAGLELLPEDSREAPYTVEDNYRVALEMLAEAERPSAVFCCFGSAGGGCDESSPTTWFAHP